MEVAKIKESKKQLIDSITDLVTKFEEKTGIAVEGISVSRHKHDNGFKIDQNILIGIEIELERI